MDSVLSNIRTLISEYEQRTQKFAVLWLAMESGASPGEVLMRVASESVPEGEEMPDELLSDDVARAVVFTMGSTAQLALNDLRFLEVLASSGVE